MDISAITNNLPTLASPSQMLRNATDVAIGAVALAVLANLPQASAGPIAGFFAGLGTAVVGVSVMAAGVVLAPTGVGLGLVATGAVIVGQAPVVGVAVGMAPTP
ncbi:MAG: hypothetical protein Q8L98_02985 [Chlamydiales bacterium]|nr:hypothetical protein [Chlamydiales bacterium]